MSSDDDDMLNTPIESLQSKIARLEDNIANKDKTIKLQSEKIQRQSEKNQQQSEEIQRQNEKIKQLQAVIECHNITSKLEETLKLVEENGMNETSAPRVADNIAETSH